ncbi:hypothetical protein [Paraburkholderia sp. J8-2]|uniref:hypothetical protein n=1 Tax=Paraburkholderia sp. J8-2 TaxID=2805440 RepID=UPI002AB6391D|nr:hypothetical protein [Paraburkholderia sp. J8-2]
MAAVAWHATAGDWGGWLLSNLIVGGSAPAVAIGVHKVSKHFGRTKASLTLFDAYRGGAVGFICLGWLAGAMADLVKLMSSEPGPLTAGQMGLFALIVILSSASTYMAVVGMAPVIATDPLQQPQPPTQIQLHLQRLQHETAVAPRQAILAALGTAELAEILLEAIKQREDDAAKLEGERLYALNKDAIMLRWLLILAVIVFGVSAWIHGVTG